MSGLVAGERPNLFLTGRPGCGKTTAVERTLALLPEVRVGGFYTRELREAGRRVGFAIVGLEVGEGVLAHVQSRSGQRVARYGVNVEEMDRVGVAALERARRESELILADEIGRMEMYSERFCAAIIACLDAPKPCLGTLQARSTPFLDRIRRRADLELIAVTPANREELPEALAEALRGLLAQD